ncbi:hypothetical protein ACWGB8_20835 [Kitasatospora sp. NPDC054939]
MNDQETTTHDRTTRDRDSAHRDLRGRPVHGTRPGPDPLRHAPRRTDTHRTDTAQDEEGQWLACHPHGFNDWCQILGPGWHQQRWQYCDGIWGKQEYCVKTQAPAPADAALTPRG